MATVYAYRVGRAVVACFGPYFERPYFERAYFEGPYFEGVGVVHSIFGLTPT